jgi:chromosome segregation ATPase
MSEIRFRCPECTQKIAVDASAAGVKIDCPTCQSRLVIPRSDDAPVEVLAKRKLVIAGDAADAVHEELQKAQTLAEKATHELQRVRAESAKTAQESRKEVEALREQLNKAQTDLAAAAGKDAELTEARSATAALRTEFTNLQATHDETQKRLAAVAEQLGTLQRERDELAMAGREAEALRGQLADFKKDIERAQSDAMTAETAHRAQLDAVKGTETAVRAELETAQAQRTQAEARLAEQAEKFTALEAERTQLTGIVEELLPLREELAKSQRELCAICESAAEKARGFEAQIEAAKNSETELRATLANLQTKHVEAQKQIAEQASRLELTVKRVVELQPEAATAKSLREQFVSAQNELERIRRQAEKTAKERDDAAQQNSRAQESEKAIRQQWEELQTKQRETDRRNAAIMSGFTALKQERADLAAELDAARKARDEAAALSAERLTMVEKVTSALEATKSEVAQLGAELSAAAEENERLKASLEKTAAERTALLASTSKVDEIEAQNRQEIARLVQLTEAAEARAKNRDTQLQLLTARAESMSGIVTERETAARNARAELERQRDETATLLGRAETAERELTETSERAKKIEAEHAALAKELSSESAELDSLKTEAARAKAELDQLKSQPKDGQTAATLPTAREKALEAERDALTAALERAKQHVNVLQARRDMLREEVATLRSKLGIGLSTPADEKPIAN